MGTKRLAVLLTLLSSSAAAAELPKVELGGRADFMGFAIHESSGYRTTSPGANPVSAAYLAPTTNYKLHNGAFINDTKIHVNVDGKARNMFSYGAHIRLNADTSLSTGSEDTVGNRTMMYVQHDKIGRLEVGDTPGAGGLFEMSVPGFTTGTYGIDGFWSTLVSPMTKRFSSYSTAFNSRGLEFIVTPNLASNYVSQHYSNAKKVNFFTKPLPGITVGVSYIPDLDSNGTIVNLAPRRKGPVDSLRSKNPPSFKNILSGGVMYETTIQQDWNFKAGLVGEAGKSKSTILRDLRAMEADLSVGYKQFKVTGSYGNWFKSWTLKNPAPGTKHHAQYWTAGAGGQVDKFGYSVTYMRSSKSGGIECLTAAPSYVPGLAPALQDPHDNKMDSVVLDVDYQLAKGFIPYAGVASFKFQESNHTNAIRSTTANKDTGYVVMVGTRVLF